MFWWLTKKIIFWLWAGWVASYLQRSLSAQVNGGVQMPPITSENSYFLRSEPQGATLVMYTCSACWESGFWNNVWHLPIKVHLRSITSITSSAQIVFTAVCGPGVLWLQGMTHGKTRIDLCMQLQLSVHVLYASMGTVPNPYLNAGCNRVKWDYVTRRRITALDLLDYYTPLRDTQSAQVRVWRREIGVKVLNREVPSLTAGKHRIVSATGKTKIYVSVVRHAK